MRFASVASVAAVAALTFSSISTMPAAHAADAMGSPTAKITISAKSADVGIGYTWGDGKLTYGGHTYKFSITGGTIAAVGFSKIEGKGTVYNLHRLQDFNGTYGAAHGEATLGNGLGGAVLENKNGVRIKIETATKGARLASSAEGLTLTLEK
ncbi:hypothetical protein [Acetobacter orleanensis]|uniref:DUF1134 domain-containing protein n=1 Tax=Acetobacter orleanensis TaxID=104099 RepID=A0A4Y3TNN3_9PROT|nr:hypothetical protein [Acetobacter orleanensis]KXV62981.1 hypothetical protein AD949_08055 [Acetobacter orleanensis]PCD79311.1 hypothetical protein CO710_06510 [Acetobacter orleanensis]GAN69714.1 hypothetical protein Abol_053_023 [Acetobacter orleanensis JCM 7639]GBR23175.1 hypothetical protein AA0473_0314 [Acetobacter orleanensis NRIC 0473]GEB82415.1 hypothetical protein AOR01nite_08920 [Acetobacter orleanensis]